MVLHFEYTPLNQNDAKNSFPILIHANEEEVRDGTIRVTSYRGFSADCPVMRNEMIFEKETTK